MAASPHDDRTTLADLLVRLRGRLAATRLGAAFGRAREQQTRDQLTEELGDRVYHVRDRLDRFSPASIPVPALPRPNRGWLAPLRSRRMAMVVACLLVIVGSGMFMERRLTAASAAPEPQFLFYYDLSTGELMLDRPGPLAQLPATQHDDSRPIVRAHVFRCGDRDEPQDQFIAFLERLTPQAKAILLRPDPEPADAREERALDRGVLIARPDLQGGWVERNSPNGAELLREVTARCDSGTLAVVRGTPAT